ncbi:MAG: AMP-binding protein [Acidimicrobiales bacterium]
MAGLVQLLAARAADQPDAIAFLVDGAGQLTYGAWEQSSNAMARGLSDRGVGRGDQVVLSFDILRWVDYAIARAAVAKLGAVAVPVRPGRSAVERSAIARHCGAARTVTPSDVAGLVDGQAGTPLSPVDGGDSLEIRYPSGPLRPLRPSAHSEDEVVSALMALEGDCVLHAFAVGSDPARLLLWAPLGPRAPTVVTVGVLDPRRVCALSEQRGVDTWWLTAATALLVVESGALAGHDTSSVRRVVLAGSPPRAALLSRLRDAMGAEVIVRAAATGPTGPSAVSDGVGTVSRPMATPVAFGSGVGETPDDIASDDIAPVAFSQEGMLWQEQFVPGSQNLPPLVRRFRGPLQVTALEAAIDEIVRRHEPLRSRFELRAGHLVQIVAPHRPLALPLHDLGDLGPDAQQAELAAALAHAGRPFDLVVGPLFEPALFRFAPDDHVVVFRVHHSVYDDWSVSVFRRELSALYTAYAAGEPSPLPELPVGFAAFSRAQRRRLAGAAGAAQLAWWRDHLAGAPFCLQLPIDDPARAEGSPQPSAQPVTVELPDELHAGVRVLARRHRATPFMTMLAAFEVLVHHYTGQDDLLMASVVANRNRPELEPMIGCFTKKILLRQDMAGDPTFTEVLARTRVSVLGALPNQDLAFETVLQETVGPAAADHGLAPYVGVMFQGVTPQMDEVTLPGVTTTGYDTSATTTRAHFAAGSDDGGDGPDGDEPWGGGLYVGTFLILSLVETAAATSLVARGAFHGPAVERLLAGFVALLGDVVADPSARVSELRVLSDDQRCQVLEMGSSAADVAALGHCAHELFEAHVARAPGAVAVGTDTGELTFAALEGRADEIARRLRACGVRRGSLVGICLEPSEHCVVAVLAVWKAGAGYVAIDPADDAAHATWVAADAGLGVIVTRAGLRPHLTAPGRRLLDIEAVDVEPVDADAEPVDADVEVGADADVGGVPLSSEEAAPGPDDVALVFYGSRASSVERGVAIEHRGVANLVAGLRGGVHRRSATGLRVCLAGGATTDGFLRHIAALLDGHALRFVGGDGESRPAKVVSLVSSGAVDVVDAQPEDLDDLLAAGLQEALLARPPDAGEATIFVASPGVLARRCWRSLRSLREARALVLYGPPECTFGATVDADVRAGGRSTVGRPLAGVTAHVLDPSGAPVPLQVTGELCVGGAGLARGDSEATAAGCFVTRSVAGGPEVRLFRTGQRARWLPDGRIEVLGAMSDAVGLRGFAVDRARIQAALVRCPGVRDARVVVEPDADGSPRLAAYVVPDRDAGPTLAQLRVFLWSLLPGYAWPAAVVVVADTAASADAVGGGRVGHRPTDHATGTAEEAFVAALWAEVVGVDRVDGGENYWQSFPFLDVVTGAVEAGVVVDGHRVARNRTVATLAVDLAAGQGE